jgi:hypothetical protein
MKKSSRPVLSVKPGASRVDDYELRLAFFVQDNRKRSQIASLARPLPLNV